MVSVIDYTHFIDYSPQNVGRDHVVTACGKLVPITDYSGRPTCPDPRCLKASIAHRIELMRERLMRSRINA